MSPACPNACPLLVSTSHATPRLLLTYFPIATIDRSLSPSIFFSFKYPSLPSNPSLQVQADRPVTCRLMPLMLTALKIVNVTPRALPVRHLAVGAVGLKRIFVMDQNCYKTKFIFFRTPSCYCFHLRPAAFISDLHFSSSTLYLTCAHCRASSTLPLPVFSLVPSISFPYDTVWCVAGK